MLHTWIVTAWRNFLKYKSFSLINIIGLSLGIACLLAISLYVLDELRFDRFHKDADRIYQVNAITSYDGSDTRYATTSTPLSEAIRSEVPEVEATARLFQRQATIQVLQGDSASITDQKYREDNFYFADPSILNIFSFDFVSGNAKSALSNPNQVILARTVAIKYFGSVERAIGRLLLFEGTVPLEVAAVVEDLPRQSSHQIMLLAHFDNYYTLEVPEVREFLKHDWLYNPVSTYVILKTGTQVADVTKKIQALNEKFADERVREHVVYELQPLTSLHLHSDFTYASDRQGIRYIYIFMIVGVLILLIACINFVNLSTVHSLKRSKEIGIRKVVGAVRGDLRTQFLMESMLLVFLSLMLAVIIVYSALPVINTLTGKFFTAYSLLAPEIVLLLACIFIVTGLGAGLYPAFYISRFNPIAALKGMRDAATNTSYRLRRVLVITQFTASIVLIIFTVVIFRQIRFMEDRPLGFEKNFMLTIPLFSDNPNAVLGGGVGPELRGRMNTFENEALKHATIEAVSLSSVLPGQGVVNALVTTGKIKESDNVFVPVISVDYDFLEAYKMQIIAGRGFSREAGTDHLQSFVANEQAIKILGWKNPEDAIGQPIGALGKQATIIGVIKDYHFEGLQQPLRPLIVEVDVSKFTVFTLRMNNQHVPESIEQVRRTWNTVFPEKYFEYHFLDDQLARGYSREQQFGRLINFFSGLAIFISSLGLFGLAAYIAHQKQKEAGIRKVLGATTAQVFYALSKEFIRVMIISFMISIPLGYFFADNWLHDFAYSMPVGLIPFVISFASTALVVFVTTAYQTLRTASLNPVDSIRND